MLKPASLSVIALTSSVTGALALTPVTFGTNWLPQAEHGGFYQSVADGTYAECGLDVTIISGGPQVNNGALLMANRIQFHMGGDLLQAFNAAAENIPVVAVMATFQKHPQVIISHPGEADTWEELKDLTLLIGDNGFTSYYQWMIAAHGFTVEQRRPYTFNPAPFLADKRMGMQGFLSSEPFAILTEAGFMPNVFLIADAGYSTYATTVEVMQSTIDNSPEVVECFVNGSILGWYNFLYGDNEGAIAMILEANPDMTRDKVDFAISMMIENGIVDSGDTLELGIGAMTPEAVEGFYAAMVEAGVVDAGLDWTSAVNFDFVGNGLGLELRPQ
ncbi:MAG: ABC transporter substrate-binding protein [Rhodobacteraceae bacterium]|nr:MAG: ABC transporter substrate-binding protein [Paracoccaceae bacterium]